MKRKTVTLYDGGSGLILILMLGGAAPIGILLDFLWNRLVLSASIKYFLGIRDFNDKADYLSDRRTVYNYINTFLGLFLDWPYFVLAWETMKVQGKGTMWKPLFPFYFQLLLIILPMLLLLAENFFLSRFYLKLNNRQALVTAASMAFFTAPWLILIFPYIAGWVI